MSENKLNELKSVISELREKCPWDKKQTFQSLRSLTIEEVYELSDAIINKEPEGIEEEVGDLLLHVLWSRFVHRSGSVIIHGPRLEQTRLI